MRSGFVRWCKFALPHCSADLVSECQEIGASEGNTTLLRSTFISVWSVCRMTIKFPAKIATWPAFHLERSSRRWRKKAIYWLAITRLSSSVCRRALRPAPRSRVRRCGGGPSRHAIAAQDAVGIWLRTGKGFVPRYGGFIDCAAAKRFCGCTRIAPPRGLSRSAIRKNASEITTGNTNRNSSPLRRSP